MFDQETSISAAQALEYRLPANVTPERYDLILTPDLKAFTFAGSETVAISVHEATTEVVLNALELEIESATAERASKSLTAQIELEPAHERARLRFGEALGTGPWTLRIKFRGILNDKLHGFYRSQYTDAAGKLQTVATTQFEATDARRAIPCWDEPALKAVFGVTLIIDDDLTALSNAGIKSERKLGNGKKEIVFKDTIRMSTYLLAFIIGEFEATAPVDAGTPLRVVHVPGKRALTGWAEQIGAYSLKFFADYYGIPYPGDKLDLIAIPDFAAGAMENLGAITFRETALLADDRTASRAELERIADVVSHENAHMWFGDLVTMRWWNGIWLNEAFATFMEMLAVDAWKPNWKRWESFGVSRGAAMAIDALKSTRSIEYTVLSPEDCRSMFDVLTYEKGAAVLRMLEQFLGAEVFRKGISAYLKKHQYNNTETGDLWDALEAASSQPVRSMMDTWIFQQGFPVVSAAPTTDGLGLKITQRRFFFAPPENPEPQLWHVPVMVRARTDHGVATHKLLLTEAETTLQLPGKLEWALLNEGGHGFYRVRYSPEVLAALTKNLSALKPIERFGLVSDTWAATVAGLTPLAEFIKMARLFRDETDINVWRALIGAFNYLDMVATDAQRPAVAAAVREIAGPAAARLGWSAVADEDELQGQLRALLLATLGTVGEDSAVQARARELYDAWQLDPSKANRDLQPAFVSILAHAGDPARYQKFKQHFKSARTPQEEQRYLFALANFSEISLLRQTMEMTLNGEVRTQNAPYLLHSLLANNASRIEAWEFLKRNWATIVEKFPDSALPRMCEAINGLLDRQAEVEEFFKQHKVRLGGKLIDQHLERLAVAVAFRQREGTRLEESLKA
ncbi:MAG: puromycin-sensitive aminopeptidase [Candidatus Binataceae bacterium]|nr:puromycin-sensitive aminopeptidase [Candidatus Binataceae bacterium]